MKHPLLSTILAFGLLAVISPQALAQAEQPPAEAQRLSYKCLEFQDAGKYDEALDPCQRSLAMYEKEFGGEHSYVATAIINLAVLYDAKGEYAKAEPLF